jgi:molybdate transport system substrate-binding protein
MAEPLANELRIFVPVAVRAFFSRHLPQLSAAVGGRLESLVDLNPKIADRIASGETYDIGLTNPSHVQALIASGHVDGASHRPFGRVPLAIGRAANGGDEPLRSGDQIAMLLREAESIAYTGAGTSGQIYLDAMQRLSLLGVVTPKSRPMAAGEPVASVAAGEIELAIAPLTTILSSAGITPVAIFPEEVGTHIDLSVFLCPSPRAGATTVLDFLCRKELDADLAAAGLMRFEFAHHPC